MYLRSLTLGAILAAVAGAASAETTDRTVKANATTAIGGFASYEVDTCYRGAIPDAKVRNQPSNGSLVIRPYQTTLGKDTHCPGLQVDGVVYVYTPKKGFKGADEVTIDVPFQSTDVGMPILRSYTFRIKVE